MKKYLFPVIAIFIIGVLSTCGRVNPPAPTNNEMKSLKIGAILPLTGKMSMIGEPERLALDMGIKNILATSPYKLEIQYYDSQGDPKIAIGLGTRAVSVDGADVLVVSTSTCVLAVKTIAQEAGVPLIALTSQPDIADGKTVFRYNPNSTNEVKTIVEHIVSNRLSNVILIRPNNDLGEAISKYFTDYSKGRISSVTENTYQIGTMDFRSMLAKLRDDRVNAICFLGYPFDIPVFVKQAREAGIRTRIITSMAGAWPMAYQKVLPSKLEYEFPCSDFVSASTRPTSGVSFYDSFSKITNSPPGYDAAFAYDVPRIVTSLLRPGDNISLSEAWANLHLENLAAGKIRFISPGDVEVSLQMFSTADGNISLVNK